MALLSSGGEMTLHVVAHNAGFPLVCCVEKRFVDLSLRIGPHERRGAIKLPRRRDTSRLPVVGFPRQLRVGFPVARAFPVAIALVNGDASHSAALGCGSDAVLVVV